MLLNLENDTVSIELRPDKAPFSVARISALASTGFQCDDCYVPFVRYGCVCTRSKRHTALGGRFLAIDETLPQRRFHDVSAREVPRHALSHAEKR